MIKKRPASESFWDVIPELDQHEVRYEEYTLKSPKTTTKFLPEKRPILTYGSKPIVDCEIDDECIKPDYLNYILPNINTESTEEGEQTTEKKELKKSKKVELSLDFIYETLHEIKHSKIRKIIKENKDELLKAQKNHPDMKCLKLASQVYSTMFNPDQKNSIYMYIRQILDIPPHLFREVQYVYTILSPIAALIIFQKEFKIDTKVNALATLAKLELLNRSFYKKKAEKDIYCRT